MTRGLSSRLADGVVILVLTLAVVACLLPFVHMAALSLSSNEAVLAQKVAFWPAQWSIKSYAEVFKDPSILRSLYFTIALTAVYTLISMALTVCCAYPLTKKNLKGRAALNTLIIITLYFSGGILPTYVLVKSLGLLNTMWSLVLPVAINPFNMIILRTSFGLIPDSLPESALIDGASQVQVLTRIVVPLSKAILATLALFYAVFRWNGFQDALFYVTKPALYTLQLKLSFIVLDNTASEVLQAEGALAKERIVPAAITAATVMVATVPILVVYPWLQRYFISGVMIGSIKG